MANWKIQDIPNQSGKVAIVTGANSGLGYISALALAQHGAQVVMANRDKTKSEEALARLKAAVPQAQVEYIPLNLASLASVRSFAEQFKQKYGRLDLLLNNAGVMAIPRRETEDGFEMQFGTNHLGHFALTGHLLDSLLATPNSRVVSTSSVAHRMGNFNFDDLQRRQKYTRYGAYGQSKLSNLLFAFELARKLEAAGSTTLSLVAHPGYANTNLQHTSANTTGAKWEVVAYNFTNRFIAQSAEMGALPQLYAATMPDVKNGEFYGPRMEFRGYPKVAKAMPAAYDKALAARLWQVSEELTSVRYNFSPRPVASL